jgi:hypothetical protein
MPCLIDFIDDTERPVWDKLEAAYQAIGRAYLISFRPPDIEPATPLSVLINSVNALGDIVDLRAAHAACPYVRSNPMDAGEVRNQLRHVEVMLGVRRMLDGLALTPSRSCPTQGSTGPKGAMVEDLEGEEFVVDVFGGADIEQNDKSRKMIDRLQRAMAVHSRRAFVAARRDAISSKPTKWRAGKSIPGVKERPMLIVQRMEDGDYVLVELR